MQPTSRLQSLPALARSKLHLSFGSKDNCSLHRWVLLKNSLVRSLPLPEPTPTTETTTEAEPNSFESEPNDEEDSDFFLFPDIGIFLDNPPPSESNWLDSLLEQLGDDDDDDVEDTSVTMDLDDYQSTSPLLSPMSSSDDLVNQSYYPYLVPYPPFQPQHSSAEPPLDLQLTSLPSHYEPPLPYYGSIDIEDLPVPDAVDDTSDDESDAPPTPSMGRSSTSLTLIDPATVPLPEDRSALRNPYVYSDDDDFYSSFGINFTYSSDFTSYRPIQEC